MKTSYLFLAEGFEEVEALTSVDVLRRAGMSVTTVSITDMKQVCGAHGIKVEADITIHNVDSSIAEWLILPGGMPGATNLAASESLSAMLENHNAEGGKIAAICASPAVVLGQKGLLNGRKAVCYPGFESMMTGCEVVDTLVAVDGNIVTGKGPAAATPFALMIVEQSLGEEAADKVAEGMLLPSNGKKSEYYF